MNKEDRITYKREETIAQLFHGKRYGAKMCDFFNDDDVDAAEIAVFNRLGEYEDTGLSPEEIEELKYKHDRLQDFEVANNEKLRQQIALLEDQLKNALAAAGNSKCKINITVEGMCECEVCRKDVENKRRIPWEAD